MIITHTAVIVVKIVNIGCSATYSKYSTNSHIVIIGIAASSPLTPLTPGMKSNLERLALNFYTYFKSIVADARSFTADEIENVAQGRVWTGEQAKEIGLVGKA